MNVGPDKLADLRVKHLEMVQSVVARMAGHGATLKNFCVTLTTGICGVAITLQRPAVALLSLLPIAACAMLDAQYLRLERRFRGFFDRVRSGDWAAPPSFEVNSAAPGAPSVGYWSAFGSWSILGFYAALAGGVVLIVTITRCVYGRFV